MWSSQFDVPALGGLGYGGYIFEWRSCDVNDRWGRSDLLGLEVTYDKPVPPTPTYPPPPRSVPDFRGAPRPDKVDCGYVKLDLGTGETCPTGHSGTKLGGGGAKFQEKSLHIIQCALEKEKIKLKKRLQI